MTDEPGEAPFPRCQLGGAGLFRFAVPAPQFEYDGE